MQMRNIWRLAIKQIAGEATPAELAELARIRESDPELRWHDEIDLVIWGHEVVGRGKEEGLTPDCCEIAESHRIC